jgi:hypothetical protein
MSDRALSDSLHHDGVNPVAVRGVLSAENVHEVSLQLVADDGTSAATERQQTSDLMFWSWVPIFSDRARSLLIRLGCVSDEFWPCRLESNAREFYFLHLPTETYDFVDVDKSEFSIVVPGDRPLPMFIRTLAVKRAPPAHRPCFRAEVPGHPQVFGELFVTSETKVSWERDGLTGAEFRKLEGSS